LRKLLALGLVICSFLVATTPAEAHAQLVKSNPKMSAVLYKAPINVMLTFDDELLDVATSNVVQVFSDKNRRVDGGATKVQGATVSTTLKKNLAIGRYRVVYRVLSADGHPVSASYYFYLKKK
jgi:methionine-rich copper-binding protein CopC